MTLYCCSCLTADEVVEAITISDGHAVCVRHYAMTVTNPAMSAREIEDRARQALQSDQRFDALGQPL